MFPWPLFWIYLTGTGNVAAGVAIVTGTLSRLAAILAGMMYGTYVLTLHVPRSWTLHLPALLTEDPVAFQRGRGGLTSLFVAIGTSGAAWIVASSLKKRDPVVERERRTANLVGLSIRQIHDRWTDRYTETRVSRAGGPEGRAGEER